MSEKKDYRPFGVSRGLAPRSLLEKRVNCVVTARYTPSQYTTPLRFLITVPPMRA